jgi:hypothetical protein
VNLLHAGAVPPEAEQLRGALVAWRRSLQTGTHSLPQSEVDPQVADEMRRHGYWEAQQGDGAD